MVTIPTPRPGTVAAAEPVPPPVQEAVRLLEDGVGLPEAIDRLTAGASVDELRTAQLWWVRRMPKESWDDHEAGAVLRVLERALANINSLVTDREADSGGGGSGSRR